MKRDHRSLARVLLGGALLAGGLAAGQKASAAEAFAALGDLAGLSIEELANVEITSVARRPQRLAEAPSSIYVITPEEIRRAGSVSIPEALRLALNLQVSRIDGPDYAISARGLNSFESSNKLLVLIDGRSVYTPVYSGVEWDAQHVQLGDLDRIEVISGPGGTLWGANAVNGVVNITTRDARQTQGLLVNATGGTVDSLVNVRYGGRLGANGGFRVFASAFERGPTRMPGGPRPNDDWRGYDVGFRADWGVQTGSTFTLQGDLYDSSLSRSWLAPEGYVRGRYLIGRWTQALGSDSSLTVQGYYDHASRQARGSSTTSRPTTSRPSTPCARAGTRSYGAAATA